MLPISVYRAVRAMLTDRVIRAGASSCQLLASRKAGQPTERMTDGNIGWVAPQANQLSWQLAASS